MNPAYVASTESTGGADAAADSPLPQLDREIRRIVATQGRLAVDIATLADYDDLFQAGMTSHANVNVMLALEEAFDIEFPEVMLRRSTFESVAAIRAAVAELTGS